jgi:hypothetical protein
MGQGQKEQTEHRYWYFVNIPEIGIRWEQGWCFGTDSLEAARNAIKWIARFNSQADYLLPGDINVTRDGSRDYQ